MAPVWLSRARLLGSWNYPWDLLEGRWIGDSTYTLFDTQAEQLDGRVVMDFFPDGSFQVLDSSRTLFAGRKLGGADYIGVHRAAHSLGIRSNCTMLYGHVDLQPKGAFEARSVQTFRLVYTVGRYGIDDTGGIAVLFRFGGAFILLAISTFSAKRMTGARVITQPTSQPERWLVDTVQRQAREAGIATRPVLLGPVRVETRFTETELLVRIFPDDWQLDSFEDRLTGRELAATRRFWAQSWGAAGDRGGRVAGRDLGQRFERILDAVSPTLAHRVGGARRIERFHGYGGHVGQLRKAHGSGWALVGEWYGAGPMGTPASAATRRILNAESAARAITVMAPSGASSLKRTPLPFCGSRWASAMAARARSPPASWAAARTARLLTARCRPGARVVRGVDARSKAR